MYRHLVIAVLPMRRYIATWKPYREYIVQFHIRYGILVGIILWDQQPSQVVPPALFMSHSSVEQLQGLAPLYASKLEI
eukprot:6093864-Pleurochrysis_carterae.AAC.1